PAGLVGRPISALRVPLHRQHRKLVIPIVMVPAKLPIGAGTTPGGPPSKSVARTRRQGMSESNLEDRTAIHDLFTRYCCALDNGDRGRGRLLHGRRDPQEPG